MGRAACGVLLALLPLAGAGCVSFSLDGGRDGLPGAQSEIPRLQPGISTLEDTLRRLGPPDLLLRSGPVDRLYYVAWDGWHFKFTVSAPLPFGRASADAFILGLGSEDLQLTRLEFDRRGILLQVQTGGFSNSDHGEYIAIDNRVVESFIEDRNRALVMSDTDDDDDDDPAARPPK